MKTKKILVTGGAGFIGHYVVRELLRTGYTVTVVDDFSTGFADTLPENIRIVKGSILDDACLKQAFASPPDCILHLAAVVSIRNSFANFYNDARTNITGSLNLLKYAIEHRVRSFVFASSMAVYGPPLDSAADLSENDAADPVSPYGLAKLTIEKYLRLLSGQYDLRCTCLRYFNTYGNQYGLSPYVGVMNIMIKSLLKGENIRIFGDGSQQRDFIHAEDVARATVLAINNERPFSVYNIGTQKATSILELGRLICSAMDRPFAPEFGPAQPGEIHRAVADNTLAAQQLCFTPQLALPDMISPIVEWNKKYGTRHGWQH